MKNLFDILFGCAHENYGFPVTIKNGKHISSAASVTGTYVVCLDCGKEFPYDWATMKIVSEKSLRSKSLVRKETKTAKVA